MQVARCTKDLGIGIAASHARLVSLDNKRQFKASARLRRAKQLGKWAGYRAGGSKKLHKAGYWAQVSYPLGASGASPSQVAKLRTAAAAATMMRGRGGAAQPPCIWACKALSPSLRSSRPS